MKKLFIILTMLSITTFTFSLSPSESEIIVENFLTKGSYVKVVTKSEIEFYYKQTISLINVEKEKIVFRTVGIVENYSGRDTTEPEFDFKSFNIASDENGNIIISKN